MPEELKKLNGHTRLYMRYAGDRAARYCEELMPSSLPAFDPSCSTRVDRGPRPTALREIMPTPCSHPLAPQYIL